MNIEKRKEAFECYTIAIEKDPNQDDAYSGLGNYYNDQNEYEKAIDCYNEAIKINSNEAHYYMLKGDCLDNSGRKEEAMESYNEAIRINPKEDNAYNGIGLILKTKKDMKKL